MLKSWLGYALASLLLLALVAGCGGAQDLFSSFTVHPSGGTVSAADGKVTLVVPADAITMDTFVTVMMATNYPSSRVVPGTAYTITSTEPLSRVATLTIAYDPNMVGLGVPASDLGIYHLNNGTWEKLGGTVDTSAHTITGSTQTLGTFAIRTLN